MPSYVGEVIHTATLNLKDKDETIVCWACSVLGTMGPAAEKAIKEVQYHLRWSGEWVIRLADGTEESRKRMLKALGELWMFTGEMFTPAPYELVDLAPLKDQWIDKIQAVFAEAGLELPKQTWMQSGGKEGRHTDRCTPRDAARS